MFPWLLLNWRLTVVWYTHQLLFNAKLSCKYCRCWCSREGPIQETKHTPAIRFVIAASNMEHLNHLSCNKRENNSSVKEKEFYKHCETFIIVVNIKYNIEYSLKHGLAHRKGKIAHSKWSSTKHIFHMTFLDFLFWLKNSNFKTCL